jgi:hypothetical protein
LFSVGRQTWEIERDIIESKFLARTLDIETAAVAVHSRVRSDGHICPAVNSAHLRRLPFPISAIILDNTKRIDPQPAHFEPTSNRDGVLKGLGKRIELDPSFPQAKGS